MCDQQIFAHGQAIQWLRHLKCATESEPCASIHRRFQYVGAVEHNAASTRTHESTGEFVDDAAVTGKVKAAFLGDPVVSAFAVGVETFKGVVQLSGFVSSQGIASRAVELTRGVKGVSEVKNDMRLR